MTDYRVKIKEIEEVLNFKLRAGVYDLEMFEVDWNAFYQNPLAYKGNDLVIAMITQWYNEIYADNGFVDAYYLEA